MGDGQHNDAPSRPIIETASATTSPDNARSGHMAYVIALIAILLLGLFGSGMSGCLMLTRNMLESEYSSTPNLKPYEQLLQDELDERDYDSFDDYLDDYFNQLYDNDGTSYPYGNDTDAPTGNSKSTSVKEILDSDLGLYDSTIDHLLPATAYANAQASVRTFVRDLVIEDRDASSEIAALLKAAAWSDGSPSAALAQASEKAQAMVTTLQGMKFPQVEGKNATSISRNLEVGRGKAIDRWKAIVEELELLSESDEVNASDVAKADAEVTKAAQEAADAFEQALFDSAAR